MRNAILNAEQAIFFDTLLKRTQGDGCCAPVGMSQAFWASLIAGGYVEKVEKQGVSRLLITAKGQKLLKIGGFWKQLSRKDRWGYKRKQLRKGVERVVKSISWRGIEKINWISGILALVVAIIILFLTFR